MEATQVSVTQEVENLFEIYKNKTSDVFGRVLEVLIISKVDLLLWLTQQKIMQIHNQKSE